MKTLGVDGRFFGVVMASVVLPEQDGTAPELEDVAPAPGRGLLTRAWWDGADGRLTFTASTNDPLPMAVIEWFVAEAKRCRQAPCFPVGETTG